MPRDIKFRGLTEENKFVFGSLVISGINNNYVIFEPNGKSYIAKPETIGQYTGLKDKNGKEIYEGDILKSCDGYIQEVEWRDNSWKLHLRAHKCYQGEKYIEDIYNPIGRPNDERFGDEVIGTIYESSELLKEEKC